jgi:hypothetical protein
MIEALWSFETSVSVYKTTLRYIPEGRRQQTVYAFLVSLTRATWAAYFILLDFIMLVMWGISCVSIDSLMVLLVQRYLSKVSRRYKFILQGVLANIASMEVSSGYTCEGKWAFITCAQSVCLCSQELTLLYVKSTRLGHWATECKQNWKFWAVSCGSGI